MKYVEIQLRRWKAKERGDSYYQQAHNAYLASPEWRDRRQRVMDRAQGQCEGCRLAQATEVHHLSYDHWAMNSCLNLSPCAATVTTAFMPRAITKLWWPVAAVAFTPAGATTAVSTMFPWSRR